MFAADLLIERPLRRTSGRTDVLAFRATDQIHRNTRGGGDVGPATLRCHSRDAFPRLRQCQAIAIAERQPALSVTGRSIPVRRTDAPSIGTTRTGNRPGATPRCRIELPAELGAWPQILAKFTAPSSVPSSIAFTLSPPGPSRSTASSAEASSTYSRHWSFCLDAPDLTESRQPRSPPRLQSASPRAPGFGADRLGPTSQHDRIADIFDDDLSALDQAVLFPKPGSRLKPTIRHDFSLHGMSPGASADHEPGPYAQSTPA